MEEKYSLEDMKTLRIGILALIVIIFISFVTISHNASIKQDGIDSTYKIYATFGRTDGLNIGDTVRMSGISIGRVIEAHLDENFKSKLTFEIDSNYQIPNDSSASIISFGLIGGKYVEIDVGGSEEYISPEESLEYTQDAMVLEELLDRIISMGKSKRNPKENNNVDVIDSNTAENGGFNE